MVVSRKPEITRQLWRWLPLLIWMGLIFWLSSQTRSEVPSFGVWDLLVKKGAHFLGYGLLALLAYFAMAGERSGSVEKRPFLIALLITILYAMSDEWHQRFVPTRNGTAVDVLIDSLGGIAALAVLWGWLTYRLKNGR